MKLDPSQTRASDLITTAGVGIVTGGPGCHRKGQKLLRSDGRMVAVEDVRAGDRLAGFDGSARSVLALRSGLGAMARIVPVKGDAFVVNQDHILTVVHSCTDEITDVSVVDYLQWSNKRREKSKLFRQPHPFEAPARDYVISPYVLGVLLGDGCLSNGSVIVCNPDHEVVEACRAEAARLGLAFNQVADKSDRCPCYCLAGSGGPGKNVAVNELRNLGLHKTTSGEKFIPDAYRLTSRQARLDVLAGLLDTDGHLTYCGTFDFISKSASLANDVAFVARSLGLAAYTKPAEKYCQTGAGGWYWRVSISGHLDMIPTRVKRKRAAPRRQIKDVLRTGFTVDLLDEPEEFFGFTLDGDGRYLMDDFTVTHNTGKTTTLRDALDRLDAQGQTYALAAPTGKAAKRMCEATGRDHAMTIHRLLGYSPQLPPFPGWAYGPETDQERLDVDLVVIDEASMLDIELGNRLLGAIDPERTRLILIGDADQLPPVSPGQVFLDMIESERVPVARLDTLHRAAQDSWVCQQSRKIIEGVLPDLEARHDFVFREVERGDQVVANLRELVTEWPEGVPIPQVLIPQKTQSAGVEAANVALQAALNPAPEGVKFLKSRGGAQIRRGDRVIQTSNNYKLEVFNGEIGVVRGFESGGPVVLFEGRDPVQYTFEQAGALQLAYALTTHKSQGSEFPWVAVVCHSTHTQMLTRQLIYTAITRAKVGVVIVGDIKGLKAATEKAKPVARNTWLTQRIQGAA